MNRLFELAAGTVIGRSHRHLGRNNQDAYAIDLSPNRAIAIVCDGCGSSPHSEVGAKLGTRLVLSALKRALDGGQLEFSPDFWQDLRQELLTQLQQMISAMGNSLTVMRDYFLFTIVGAVLTPDQTAIFSLGDGVVILNEEVILKGSVVDNCPPFLAYGLVPTLERDANVQFQVIVRPTATVNTLVLGSDGVKDLAPAGSILPAMAALAEDPRIFQNPDRLRRYLAQCNREIIHPDWDNQVLDRQGGRLEDDTTLVLIRRKQLENSLC
ncbi:protein phosphatase 2C domain-containing protein [Candidatus Synechococcus calcipolaris G9]|uniref:Protein phosphatase 2C domain-containing protein n=1 Tax=Candidatus Synechococcus calcipolaris G9 TaxID=1497997 RepID=A0ABT6EY20_9SYNE|nr:protein phosphatase 2C domain-containing protein [Candidatus Synechococcus calcipolaris]MDG2990700.1 protein phosphatase 2C domain-containing protein [Candidatus Synechococcus calcipolaris G9]